MAMISLDDVTKIYAAGARPALDSISFSVERGEFVFLVGESGSGKTTLLQLLLHEEEANKGELHVMGQDVRRMRPRMVPKYRRGIGFVFQDYKLLPNKTVWQNVAFALEVIGAKRSTVKTLVPQVLKIVGLTGKEKRYPSELSGGEAQRVAVARAYVNHPALLLADEPTGNLDPTTSAGIMKVLDAINRTGTTVIMATHNEDIVNSMHKRVIELHEGKLVRDEADGVYDSSIYAGVSSSAFGAAQAKTVKKKTARKRKKTESAAKADHAAPAASAPLPPAPKQPLGGSPAALAPAPSPAPDVTPNPVPRLAKHAAPRTSKRLADETGNLGWGMGLSGAESGSAGAGVVNADGEAANDATNITPPRMKNGARAETMASKGGTR